MSDAISSRNLAAVEQILTHLALDTHGALSVLGSGCINQFGGTEAARARVSASVEVWRSDVIVARQLLRLNDEGDSIREALDGLLDLVSSLGVSFTKLLELPDTPPAAIDDLSQKFPAVYRNLELGIEQLGMRLGLELSFPAQFNSLRRTTFERSLKWLGMELSNAMKSVHAT